MTLNSLKDYGIQYQIKVLNQLIYNPDFLHSVFDGLKEEYFPNDAHQWVIEEIKKYYIKYKGNITLDVLKAELQKLDNEVLKVSIKEQIKKIVTTDIPDSEYIISEFSRFCKNQQLKSALLESVDLLKVGNYDDIEYRIKEAMKVGTERNLGHIYDKQVELRYREDTRNAIPFPWTAFNNITQGGYGDGDLVLVFGNPKGGKSWAVMAMAAEAVKLGYNIVFYALELGETYVAKRFDAIFTGIPVDELHKHRSKVDETVSNLPGKLTIKEYPPKRASLSTIESHIRQLDEKPDAIFIDYLDLLKNRRSRNERKDDIDDVYTDAKGMAKELKIPVISPSQANRTGADKAILESSHIAGSFDKIMIGDIVISLSRNRVDRLEGTGRWHFMGNRYGPDGCTFNSYNIDTSTGYFEIDEEFMDEEEIESHGKSQQKDIEKSEKKRLKQKFFELEGG